MKHYLYIIVIFFSFPITVYGQTSTGKLITGKIICDIENLQNISVVNISNNEAIVTDKDGIFSINVKGGDLLVITGDEIELKKKMIVPDDLKKGEIEVSLVSVKNMLKEVVIRKDITAQSLGIVEKEVKPPTTAERRSITGTKVVYIDGTVCLDPLLNYISGRTKSLKKDLETEKKREFINKVEYLFDENFYIKSLLIPIEYINGFKYFCLDDKDFKNLIDKENISKIKFRIIDLAKEYNMRIAK